MLLWFLSLFIFFLTDWILKRLKTQNKETHTTHTRVLLSLFSHSAAAYLEMEDAGVSVVKTLVVGDDSSQGIFLEGQGSDGGQEPAVPYE